MGPSPPASRPGNQAQGSRRLAPMGGPRGAPSSKPCPPSLGCRSPLSSPLPSFQYLGPGPVPRVTHKWGADRNAAGVTSRAGDLGDVMGGRAARPVVGPQAGWTSRAQRGRRAPRRLWTSPPCEGEVLPRSPPPRPGSGGPAGWCCPTAQAWAHRETPGKWPWPGAGWGGRCHLSQPRPAPSAAAAPGSGLGPARSPPHGAGCSGPALGTAKCPGQKDRGQLAAWAECRATVSHLDVGAGGTACRQSGLGHRAAELTSRPWGRGWGWLQHSDLRCGHRVGMQSQVVACGVRVTCRDCALARTWLSGVGSCLLGLALPGWWA